MPAQPSGQPEPDPTPGNGRPPGRRVIVAGFGVVGRMVAEQLEDADVDVTLVDLNPRTVETQRRLRRAVVHGSVTDPDTLRRAGIDHADAVIVAIPDEHHAIQACRVARELHPTIFIAARANYVSRGILCAEAGADCVIVEEIVTAEAMQRAVMGRLLPAAAEPAAGDCLALCPPRPAASDAQPPAP